jgi:RHS repeat-associated protein
MGAELTFNMPSELPDNKYLYNGKELQSDFELGWYDYGARFYDPVLGRFVSIDPLAEYSYKNTPYRFGFNSPVNFIDPTGMFELNQTQINNPYTISNYYLQNLAIHEIANNEANQAVDTTITLNEVEIIGNVENHSNSLWQVAGFYLVSMYGGINPTKYMSIYEPKTLNIDDFLGQWNNPGSFQSGNPLASAEFLMWFFEVFRKGLFPGSENVISPAQPTSDEKIKEESTGKGKNPGENGKDENGDKTTNSGKKKRSPTRIDYNPNNLTKKGKYISNKGLVNVIYLNKDLSTDTVIQVIYHDTVFIYK